jgi:flavin-dependent dehydrogenase
MSAPVTSDVLVIGAGPAGCTAAALLARNGWNVRILEKTSFPRYHIGESLMPYCWFTLERLGVLPEMDRLGFVRKYSVQFVNMDGKTSKPFYFFQHYEHPSSTTWQVWRTEFDQMLLDRALEDGALIHHNTKAVEITCDPDTGAVNGAAAMLPDGSTGQFRAKIVIDATGRDALMQTKRRWRRRDPLLNKIAVWTYFRGALRDPGLDEGSTTVAYLPDKGWFWFIPLRGGVTSVGVVAERDYLFRDGVRDPAQILRREIPANAWIAEHLASAEQFGEHWVTGEYSYRSEYCATDGAVLIGDAFSFLDPVFSSGVFLALKTGELAADAIDAALRAGDVSAARFDAYGEKVCAHLEKMRRLVCAFYDQNFSFGEFVRKHPGLRGDLTDCLIGHLDRDFCALQDGLREFAAPPPELPEGRRAERLSLACAP